MLVEYQEEVEKFTYLAAAFMKQDAEFNAKIIGVMSQFHHSLFKG